MAADPPEPLDSEVLRQILEGTEAGIVVLDTDLRYVYVNPALARMNGVPAAEHTGRTIPDVLPALEAREDVLRQVLADGIPRETTSSGHTRAASGHERRYWHGAYHRLERDGEVTGLVGIVLEVSASRQVQHDLEKARERLALLDTAATRIGTTLDIDTTCAELADFLVPVLADAVTVDVIPPEQADGAWQSPRGTLRLRRAAISVVPELRGAAAVFEGPGEYVRFRSGSAIPRSMESGRPLVDNRFSHPEGGRSPANAERVVRYRAAGIHSGMVVPLAARGHPIGTVTLMRAGDTPDFADEDVVIAQDLAGRAAISLDNARRYTREHGIALELQRALLSEPATPQPTVEVASRYLPAGSTALVGGDWFDTVQLSGGRTLLAMGDVMGHGVEAAVDMGHYRSMLRVLAAADLPPDQILEQLDALIIGTGTDRPATCLLAVADPERETVTYASAGHLPPAALHMDGHFELLPVPPGPPLGTGIGGYVPVERRALPGPVLLFTDGLVERRGEDIDRSLRRLTELAAPVDISLDALLDRVLAKLVTGTAEDDVAVLAARLRKRPA
ncbi:SpoIIE family protein phosphatase [Streptomyces silvisoli]|uniref:SpoIIE family protein phosphatase n=1 Tax=Streptomyces silvisoli TaxID=3034235 RepID=A0ABT5ZQU9_9ACTN|nr:SpoIIE family protein phosphatase [Streptomyces silvisoli]MDF3292187.1 SpoIIE family protein phosphatase [Streptomyces silvisoli]